MPSKPKTVRGRRLAPALRAAHIRAIAAHLVTLSSRAPASAITAWVMEHCRVSRDTALALINAARQNPSLAEGAGEDSSEPRLTVTEAMQRIKTMRLRRRFGKKAIRLAAQQGRIAGAALDTGGYWTFPVAAFDAWATDPAQHRPGRRVSVGEGGNSEK